MIQTAYIGANLPSLNDMLAAAKVRKGAWSQYGEMKACYGKLCQADLRKAKLHRVTKPVTILFKWHCKDMKTDPDNRCAGQKFVLDALVALQILPDDSWKWIKGLRHEWCVDRERPGVWVVIES